MAVHINDLCNRSFCLLPQGHTHTHRLPLSSAVSGAQCGPPAEFYFIIKLHTTIFWNVQSIHNRYTVLKCVKIIMETDVLQLWASKTGKLSQTQCKKKKKRGRNSEWAGIVLMLNKQTPSATNYAVQTMKWHFTMALWCFIPTFLPNKALSHISPHVQTHCCALSTFSTR